MESVYTLQSQTVTAIPTSLSSLSKQGFSFKASENNQFLRFPNSRRCPHSTTKFTFLGIKARSSGPVKASSEAVEAKSKKSDSKEKDLVFVAGATGKVGSRTVRELLKLGFRVRAGVRSAQRAESLVQSVKQMKLENADKGTQPVEKLEIVECDLEKRDRIRPALGNASVVVCCIGAGEKEISDFTGPYRIDYQATKNLVDAATVAKVDHFILVTSLGTNKIGFPAAILNLFWGVLIWKRKAEEALIASRLPYTIVRPGGMERPTDAYKETHNITLSEEDTLFGGQVSNLQVAELIACMAKNTKLSYCKVVEAIAETTAPLTPMEDLLAKISSKRPYISSPTESVVAAEPEAAPSWAVTEEPKPTNEEVATQEKPVEAKPLSPYAGYEDLKPPTYPTPSSSSGAKKASDLDATHVAIKSAPLQEISKASVEEEAKKTRPLSPYACYDDLKPPTSPTPTPKPPTSKSDINTVDASSSTASASVAETSIDAATSVEEAKLAPKRASPLSPYAAYEDLKPPTSPTPTPSASKPAENVTELTGGNDVPSASKSAVNSVTETSISSGNNKVLSPVADKPPSDQPNQAGPKPRPLSPYSMYEELKPPTSPIPSSRSKHH